MNKLQQLTELIKSTDFVYSISFDADAKPNFHVDMKWLLGSTLLSDKEREWVICRTPSGKFMSVSTEFNGCTVQALLDSDSFVSFTKFIGGIEAQSV